MGKEKEGPVVGSNAWLLREVQRLSKELAELKQSMQLWQKQHQASKGKENQAGLFALPEREQSISDRIERFCD